MNKNSKIGLLDSGYGGLSVLKEVMNILPNEDYLYYADTLNNPYGVKNKEELFNITSSIVDFLIKNDCKIIVLACNTATTSCIEELREKYKDMIFIGTVPAIKVAYDNGSKNTIILSTPSTTMSNRVKELLHDYTREDQEVIKISGKNLANLIELDKKEEYMDLLHSLLDEYKDKADTLVLGCTHYSLIKDDINKILPNTILVDGTLGIAKEVKRKLEEYDLLNPSTKKGSLDIINSKDKDLVERGYKLLKKLEK